MTKILMLAALLSGCARLDYLHTAPSGDQYRITGWSVGNTAALSDFSLHTGADGSKDLGIGALQRDQAQALGAIAEGAVKGAAMALKP